jgi:hypothetical protein
MDFQSSHQSSNKHQPHYVLYIEHLAHMEMVHRVMWVFVQMLLTKIFEYNRIIIFNK